MTGAAPATAADAEADAGGWRVLRPQTPDCCAADADGDHLFVLEHASTSLQPAIWRCFWCAAVATPLWCSAP